jgi:hypothetical protein
MLSWDIWYAALLTRMSPPELVDGPSHELFAVGLLADVARHRDPAAASLLDDLDRLLGIGVLVEVGHDDVGSLAGERERHGPSDPTVGTRDERGLALETGAPDVGVLAVVGPRLHL